jgi:hypothetical protein
MKKVLCLGVLLMSFPAASFAAGFSGVVSIKTVHIEGNNFAMVIFPSAGANPDSCGNSTEAMVEFSDTYYQSTLAVFTEAYVTGSAVQFYYVGCAATPWGYTIPHIWSVDLNP